MPQLPIVTKRYFVDRRLKELRNVNNPHDMIRFASDEEMNVALAEFADPADFESKLAENAVAISDSFHGDERYDEFYAGQGQGARGFPEIWSDLADAAHAFTRYEVDAGIDWGITQHREWIDAIDAYVDLLYEKGLNHGHDALMQLAAEACKAVPAAE